MSEHFETGMKKGRNAEKRRTGGRRSAKPRTEKKAAQAANGHARVGRLEPDRDQLKDFIKALFRHAGTEGYVSIRSFHEDDASKSYKFETVQLEDGLDAVIEAAAKVAKKAANASVKVVFSPPIVVLDTAEADNEGWRARAVDTRFGLALSVECDQHPREAREKLEQLLGPATVVVASGGEWVDPETGEVEPKLHLHWRLAKPAGKQGSPTSRRRATSLRGWSAATPATSRSCIRSVGQDAGTARGSRSSATSSLWMPSAKSNSTTRLVCCRRQPQRRVVRSPTARQADDTARRRAAPNWGELIGAVLSAESYHEPLVRLAAKLIKSGMDSSAAVNMLRGWMEASDGPRDERWQARYDDIDRAVKSAEEKYGYGQQDDDGDGELKPEPPKEDVKPLLARRRARGISQMARRELRPRRHRCDVCRGGSRAARRRPALAAHHLRAGRRQDRDRAIARRRGGAHHQHDCQRGRAALGLAEEEPGQDRDRRTAAQDRRARHPRHQGCDHHLIGRPQHAWQCAGRAAGNP